MRVADVIREEEGYGYSAYLEEASDRLHIGYGFNIDERSGCGLPREVAGYWLEHLISASVDDLIAILGPAAWVAAGEARQAALTSMHYQLGASGFRGFRKMLTAIRRKDWEEAAAQCLDSKAARTPELRVRYQRNAAALLTGEWQWGK